MENARRPPKISPKISLKVSPPSSPNDPSAPAPSPGGPEPAANGATDPGPDPRVAATLGHWQEKLLQLDRRNRLLYFREGRSAVPFRDTTPDEVSGWLDSAPTKRWRFVELDEGRTTGRRSGAVRTDLEPAELRRRLTTLRRKDREWEEEQGLNVLFLAVGFLHWTDVDHKPAESPLALIPCDLERESVVGPWFLKRENDEVEANVTLAYLLQKRFEFEIPEYEEQGLPEYLAAVEEKVATRGWTVTPDLSLGAFAFSKLAMYEDLERMRAEGVAHPLVLRLAGGRPETEGAVPDAAAPSALPEDEALAGGKLDDLLKVRDQYTVVDADFSQLRAIEMARRGDCDQVIHGPPGTGKSQTITNMIAGLLADGKRVLFVSEKTAALDVVKRRLDDCGLGVFCLDLHSERGRKASVYSQLRESIEDPRRGDDGDAFRYDELESRRDDLNRFVRALHRVREPLGRSVFRVQGDFARVRDLPDVDFEVGDLAALDAARCERIEEAASRLSRRPQPFREHETSVWLGLRAGKASLGLADTIRKAMDALGGAVRRARAEAAPGFAWTGIPEPADAAALSAAADLLDHLSAGVGVPRVWLRPDALPRLRRMAGEREERQRTRNELQQAAREDFGESRPEADWAAIAETLQRVEADAGALEGLFGPEWRERVLPDPRAGLDRRDELEAAAGETSRHFDRLGALLPGEPPGTVPDFASAITHAEELADLFPVPRDWLRRRGIEEARTKLGKLRERLRDLQKAEAKVFADFDEEILGVVDRAMLRRFRDDFSGRGGHLLHFLSYHRDRKALRGAQKSSRKRTPQEWSAVVADVLSLKYRRNEWKQEEKECERILGSRFRGRETDCDALAAALDRTAETAARWPGDPALRRALTDETRHDELRVALPAARKGLERLRAALSACDAFRHLSEALDEETDGEADGETDEKADSPTPPRRRAPRATAPAPTELAAAAGRALDPLRTLVGVMEELGPGFREPPGDLPALAAAVHRMAALTRMEREDEDAAPKLRADFGPRFRGADTDWAGIRQALEWTATATETMRQPLPEPFSKHLLQPEPAGEYTRRAAALRRTNTDLEGPVEKALSFFDPTLPPGNDWRNTSFDALTAWAEERSRLAPTVSDWLDYRGAVRDLEQLLSPGLVDRIRAATGDAESVPGIIRRRVCRAVLDDLCPSDPDLAGFNLTDHRHLRERFRELDRDQFEANRRRVRSVCFGNYPDFSYVGAGNLSLLRRELQKKRRQMSVRRLIRRIPQVVQALKPCLLMSPLAVSQYLPWSPLASDRIEFDAAIFDEASQVFPEDAVPAIARAGRTILAGDEKQLPPTSFFRAGRDDDADDRPYDEEDEDSPDQMEGQESILKVLLGMVGNGVREGHLLVHYRSRHEDLIRYSNHYFYGNRLLVFPSPGADASLGVRSAFVPEGRYAAGASRTNDLEAARVVDLVFETLERTPLDESLGVVALSRAQSDRIDTLLSQRRLERRDLDQRFDETRHERFFVKNLENVQGDERDHIILSVGYGPTVATGQVHQRFGPLNREGGERRLNVAVSRARRTMTLVHSLRADQILENADQPGRLLLKRYLEYAADPKQAFEAAATVEESAEVESPFEAAVLEALLRRGHRVVPQVGVAGYRIDLGIRAEDGEGFDLGVECDGLTYHSAPAARDRDRLRQAHLEGLGWRLHRIWSTAWVENPEARIAEIEEALAKARSPARSVRRPPTGAARKESGGGAARPDSNAGAPRANPAGRRKEALPRPPGMEAETESEAESETEETWPQELGEPAPLTEWPENRNSDPLFEEYREASLLDLPAGPDLVEESPGRLARLVDRVIEVEGPVHRDLIVERVRGRYGLRRSGKRIQARLDLELRNAGPGRIGRPAAGAPDREKVFWTTPDRTAGPRRPAAGKAPRKIEHHADSELEAGVLLVAGKCFGAGLDDLVNQTAREFGFRRTGAEIEKKLSAAVRRLHRRGHLVRRADALVVTDE